MHTPRSVRSGEPGAIILHVFAHTAAHTHTHTAIQILQEIHKYNGRARVFCCPNTSRENRRSRHMHTDNNIFAGRVCAHAMR